MLRQRILTALVLLAIVLPALFYPDPRAFNGVVLLAIAAFSLSLLGTFLVRSGVLTSVHAFASDPERGVFILIFLLFVVGGSLTLFALRAPVVKSQVGFNLWSFGETVTATPAAGYLLLRSTCVMPTQCLDWGKNRRNVEALQAALGR